jgi:tetratricopeptide (TPR) repeat protein
MKRIKNIFPIIACCLILCALPFRVSAQQLDIETQRRFDYFFYHALNAKVLERFDEAMDFLLHCYAIDPANADVLAELGAFFGALGETDKALDFLRRAVLQDETNFYFNMMLAELSQELDLRQDVIDIYTRLLELYPDKVELYFDLANAFADNGNLQEAIDALNNLEKNVGVSEIITLHKVQLYLMMGEKAHAINEIRQIIEENPTDPRFYILIGDLYLEDNQTETALQYYEKAREIAPNFPMLILSMVNFYESTSNRTAAQGELRRAITSPALDVEAKIQLLARYIAFLQQGEQDISEVNELFHILFDQHPDNTELNFIYANVMMMQENEEEAIRHFWIFIRENPNNPAGYEQLLRMALIDEDLEKIIDISTEALQYLPQEPQFYFYLGAAKFQKGRYEEALQMFKDGLQNATFQSEALKSIFFGQVGDLYHQLGNQELAFENYNKALQLDPMNLPVLNNYAYFLALARRDLDRAEQMSGITIRAEPTNPTFLDTYGWVLYMQGAYSIARIYLERAIEHSRDNPSAVIFEQYGDVLYQTNDRERALEMWKRARELGGDSEILIRKIETGTYHRE